MAKNKMAKKSLNFVGIDEAGRGPLAGPVAVGAILANKALFKKILDSGILNGLTDSKKISDQKRRELYKEICNLQKAEVLKSAVTLVGSKIIDEQGITVAIKIGIKRVLKKLAVNPDETEILLDGSLFAPMKFKNQKTIIGGDLTEPIISAASIMAKVYRDNYMINVSKKYSEYGLEIHKGYGTRGHRTKISKNGLSPIHRKSFCGNIKLNNQPLSK